MVLMAIAMGSGCSVLIANRHWRDSALLADLRTGVGEVRRMVLADGSVMLMDTSTAVNLRFDEGERRLVLIKGRIALTSGSDSEAQRYRPLFVQTPHGQVRALGTRFQTQVREDGTQVQVLSDAVGSQTSSDVTSPASASGRAGLVRCFGSS